MVGSKAQQTKVHFKGKDDDFIVFVEDFPSYQKWKRDNTVPLAQVVNVFKIFITHK
jgi:Shwachman-Bodian-Diamond syndrome (SBDS) protein